MNGNISVNGNKGQTPLAKLGLVTASPMTTADEVTAVLPSKFADLKRSLVEAMGGADIMRERVESAWKEVLQALEEMTNRVQKVGTEVSGGRILFQDMYWTSPSLIDPLHVPSWLTYLHTYAPFFRSFRKSISPNWTDWTKTSFGRSNAVDRS